MFLKLFNKELYYLLKKTGVTYIATVCGALICLGITSLANVMYSVEPEMMWCLRIIGVFFFAVSVLLCISVQLLVFIRRFTSTVIGNEGYLTFSLPASTYSIVAAKVLATLCCSMLSFGLCVLSASLLAAVSDNLNYVLSFIMMFLGDINYPLLVALVVFFFLSQILSAFFAVCNGFRKPRRRIASAVIFAAVGVCQTLCVAVVGVCVHFFAPYAFYMGSSTFFFSWVPSLIVIGVCAVSSVVLYFLLCAKLKKGLTLPE